MDEEVYMALKEMRPTKTLGFDGFLTLFFQRYWHIVGNDVVAYSLGILNMGKVFNFANTIDIMFIPKVSNLRNLVNFRPISLCSVLYKIVVETIANRLQCVIGSCIDSA